MPRTLTLSDHRADLLLAESADGWLEARLVPRFEEPGRYSGMPMYSGLVSLEWRSDLSAYDARGLGAEVGRLWRQAWSLPQIDSALRRPVRAIAGLDWRVEKPTAPDWLTAAEYDRLNTHWEYCRRLWYRWTRPGRRRRLSTFVREVLRTSATAGFYWGEMGGARGRDGRIWPDLPFWRAPWAVRYWLTEGDDLRGVIADFSAQTDYLGAVGDHWAVIPEVQLIHVGAEQIGPNWEGTSWLRAADRVIQLMQEGLQARGLAVEANALGLLFFKLGEGATDAATVAQYEKIVASRKSNKLPGGVLRHGDDVMLLAPQSTMPNLDPILDSLEADALMGLDAEDRGIAVQAVGAFAAREQASDDARDGWDYVAEAYIASALEQAFLCALRMDFEADWREHGDAGLFVPSVRWGPLETRDPVAYTQGLATAVAAGLLDDPRTRHRIADLYDLSLATEVEGEGGDAEGVEADEDAPSHPVPPPAPGANIGQLLDPAVLAPKLGLTRGRIIGLVRRGEVRGGKVAGVWRVDEADLERYLGQQIPADLAAAAAASPGVPGDDEEASG